MKLRLFGLLVFATCLCLYLVTLTDVHTFDALSYILDVDRKPWPELFHVHHLAYGPLGALLRAGAVWFGWQGSVALILQWANALAGAIGTSLFALLLFTLTKRYSLATLGALLLGASYAFWYYAVEVEVYTIAAVFLVLALAQIVAVLGKPSAQNALALGLIQSLAVLFHQTNVLLTLPILLAWWLGSRRQASPIGKQSKSAHWFIWPLLYFGSLGLLVGAAYLGVGLGVSGFRSWESLYTWAAGYTQTGWWGGTVDTDKWADLGRGLAETFAQPSGALLGGGLLILLLSHSRGLRAAPAGLTWVLLAWLAIYGGFFLWWEPDNIEFWIASLPPFYCLLILAIAGSGPIGEPQETALPQPIGLAWLRSTWALLALGGLAVTMLVVNAGSILQRGDANQDLQRSIARSIAQMSAPGDLLLVPDGLLELYLPYYERRENSYSLNQAMALSQGNWASACADLQARANLALQSGFAVLIAETALRPVPAKPGEPPTPLERFGLRAADIADCYAPFSSALRPVPLGQGLPEYWQVAAAQELADGQGWDFRLGSWGWQLLNSDGVSHTEQGLQFTPDIDPALLSPPMQIDTTRYRAIELRLAATTAARDAQLFFLDASGQASEEASVRWELQPGGELQTYILELQGVLGWQGIISRLRIDPVGAGDGGSVVIESLRLIP